MDAGSGTRLDKVGSEYMSSTTTGDRPLCSSCGLHRIPEAARQSLGSLSRKMVDWYGVVITSEEGGVDSETSRQSCRTV